MTRTRGSMACRRAMISKLLSVLPSSDEQDLEGAAPARQRVGELAVELDQ